MAGQLTIDTLKASSGVLATQNGMTGIAKAWINYDSVNQVINASFNVSSVTLNATGDFTLTFTTAMPNANYGVATCTVSTSLAAPVLVVYASASVPTTTTIRMQCGDTAATKNQTRNYIAIFSS